MVVPSACIRSLFPMSSESDLFEPGVDGVSLTVLAFVCSGVAWSDGIVSGSTVKRR